MDPKKQAVKNQQKKGKYVQQSQTLTKSDQSQIVIELVKKSKKNEPKVFPQLMLVDKEAFESVPGSEDATDVRYVMKEFWRSPNAKIIVAKKRTTGAILGYAIFTDNDTRDPRFGKRWIKMCYLMRIAVRKNNQGQGIGKKLVNYLFLNYQQNSLSLDVSTDNVNAIEFYKRVGLKIKEIYLSEADKVEFAAMESEMDQNGKKILSQYEINLNSQAELVNANSKNKEQIMQPNQPTQSGIQNENNQTIDKLQILSADPLSEVFHAKSGPKSHKVVSVEISKDILVHESLTESPKLFEKETRADVTNLDQSTKKMGDLTVHKKHDKTKHDMPQDGQDSTDSSLQEHVQCYSGSQQDLKIKEVSDVTDLVVMGEIQPNQKQGLIEN